jgi:hypothetical protein
VIVCCEALGLDWSAEVKFTPPLRPTWHEPEEPGEIEIIDLFNAHGEPCNWVLESDDVREQIEDELLAVAEAKWRRAGARVGNDEP